MHAAIAKLASIIFPVAPQQPGECDPAVEQGARPSNEASARSFFTKVGANYVTYVSAVLAAWRAVLFQLLLASCTVSAPWCKRGQDRGCLQQAGCLSCNIVLALPWMLHDFLGGHIHRRHGGTVQQERWPPHFPPRSFWRDGWGCECTTDCTVAPTHCVCPVCVGCTIVRLFPRVTLCPMACAIPLTHCASRVLPNRAHNMAPMIHLSDCYSWLDRVRLWLLTKPCPHSSPCFEAPLSPSQHLPSCATTHTVQTLIL